MLRGKNAQVPGPPTVTSSPILNVISPASTNATSSLSRWRWKRLLVPAGTVSSNSMRLSPVSRPRSFNAAKRPGAFMSRYVPPSAGTTRPLDGLIFTSFRSAALSRWRTPTSPDLAQPLVDEAPAVALDVEGFVGVGVRAMAAGLSCDPRPRGEGALV